ncbi:thioesterase II family protein [Shimazuella kribbensis]|uniref:thioesterase II family protein n=1 Tax=Shimazuella kribbensis TaxID=139808 RepID=UPI000409E8BB|nr:alpha/beta fold hydrolase [Shimazuella kribbensis]
MHKRQGRLICFHHAGGNPHVFQSWSNWLGSTLELVSIALPGHGTRYREELIPHAEALATAVIPHILPFFDEPVFFLGHSMGASIALETVRQLVHLDARPNRLYIVGAFPPHVTRPRISNQSDKDFLQAIYKLGGMPKEFFDDPDLMSYLLPILRNDFLLTESYQQTIQSLDCPLTVYGGDKDIVPQSALIRWEEINPKQFCYHIFKGNHFFLHENHDAFRATFYRSIQEQIDSNNQTRYA